jgi:arsenate reductase
MTTEHHGRCLCGDHHFQAEGDPLWVAYCHCESCRRFNGAPAAAYVGYGTVRVRFNQDDRPYFASSPEVRRSFCDRCGTPLAYEAEWFPGEIHLFRTNFDHPADFEPTRHVLYHEHEQDHEIYDDLPRYGTDPGTVIGWGPKPALRVLFLCTGNSARSILAEGILNLKGAVVDGKRVRGHSAGSTPTGVVHPEALALLEPCTFRLDHLRSKSWDEFSSGPNLDWVITLCDTAAAESCPIFPGKATLRHWGLPDPASGAATFRETWQALDERIEAFLDEVGANRR